MYHFTAVQMVLGVAGLFAFGLGVGATFAVLLLHDERRATRRERALIDRWDETTSSGLLDRFAEPEPAPVEPEPTPGPEVLTPSVADISYVDSRRPGYERLLLAAAVMGALMERNQQGPVREGRHRRSSDDIAAAQLFVALSTRTSALPILKAEVA